MITEFFSTQFHLVVSVFKATIVMAKVMPEETMMGFGMFLGIFLAKPMFKMLDKLNDAKKGRSEQ